MTKIAAHELAKRGRVRVQGNQCIGKDRYASKAVVEEVIARNNWVRMKAYKCPLCHKWHMATKKGMD
jgi:hypothetical protein